MEACPKEYLTNEDACELAGEMVFPFPFSILAGLITLGLIIAELMKNQTQFLVTLLAFTDLILKSNWVFLLISLIMDGGSYLISTIIIASCLLMNLGTNTLLWRISFRNNRIWEDPIFMLYTQKFPLLARLIYYSSLLLTF